MNKNTMLLIVVIVILSGCANTAEYLRSQPTTHFPASTTIVVPDEISELISMSCMKEMEMVDSVEEKPQKQCLYLSANASNITSTLKKEEEDEVRDKMISFLLSISDLNCSNFLHRAFANKAGLDFSKSFIDDLAKGASAGTAHANPTISAALSVGNLIVGKGVESFNATYYYDKTFQAMEAAIAAERIKIKTFITAKQAKTIGKTSGLKYGLVEAVSDIRAYDDACSIKAGLSKLVQLADVNKEEESKINVEVRLDDNPAKKALELQGITKK
ncbi:MAG: hypothetical protein GY827_03595 [Cytophagales bacterium]|nr:hypothetical protein [Cytophagales bacterium]